MAKVSIKSERITPFGGIFHVRELFSRFVGPVIDKVLGLRCTSFGYQYSEIVGSLASVYFCGCDCVEDVTSHLMPHLSLHPALRTCSYDTPLGYAACHSKNFYKFLMGRLDTKTFGLKKTSRIKAFVFKFFASKAA